MGLSEHEVRRRAAVAEYLRARLRFLGLRKSDAARLSGRRPDDPPRYVIERSNFTRWMRDDPPPTAISPQFFEPLRGILRLSAEEWARVLKGDPPPADAEPSAAVVAQEGTSPTAEWRLASKLRRLTPQQVQVLEATVNAMLGDDAGNS